MQNGYIESFNGRFRDKCPNALWFENLHQARTVMAAWRRDYNEVKAASAGYHGPGSPSSITGMSAMLLGTSPQ